MSNSVDLQTKMAILSELPGDGLKSPNNIPVDAYLQEAENLYHWAGKDREKLVAKGFNWQLAEDLPRRAGALREAESNWITTRFARKEAEAEWLRKSPEAYDLRDDLIQTFRFAYRNAADLLGRVAVIAEGNSNADMIQDLNDLSVLGRENTAGLSAINFDMSLLDKAAETADYLADLLGHATTDHADMSSALDIRNRAYTHCKEAVDEIYDYGSFVFRHNEARLKGYSSAYLRRRNRNYRANKAEIQTQTS